MSTAGQILDFMREKICPIDPKFNMTARPLVNLTLKKFSDSVTRDEIWTVHMITYKYHPYNEQNILYCL